MERKIVDIFVKQSIEYSSVSHSDDWKLESQGEYINLTTYSRIDYQDEDGLDVQVKWYLSSRGQDYIVEIKQTAYTLVFDAKQKTTTAYSTPQGQWNLEIETNSIVIGNHSIHINYLIRIKEEEIGIYDFRLQYH